MKMNYKNLELSHEVYFYPIEALEGFEDFEAPMAISQWVHSIVGFWNELVFKSKHNMFIIWKLKQPNPKIMTYIWTMLTKFLISEGIGPESWFFPKSKTLRNFNDPIDVGIGPMSLFSCKILHELQLLDESWVIRMWNKVLRESIQFL